MGPSTIWATFFIALSLLVSYLWLNERKLSRIPLAARAFSPRRKTPRDVWADAEKVAEKINSPISNYLPPKTGRRYIVVGGSGFLGGWIVNHLLQRGENPKRIRILGLRSSNRPELLQRIASGVDFHQVDISDYFAVQSAFSAPWPEVDTEEVSEPPLTVFHTASNVRHYERAPSLLPASTRVNVTGTRNVINAARSVDASVLLYASSGCVTRRRVRLWLWPWESEPQHFVQALNDDDENLPADDELVSNFSISKLEAERLVRAADRTPTAGGTGILRTGAVRPGTGLYGPHGDKFFGSFLVSKVNPFWSSNVVQSFTYVENCALAHLCYERCLINLSSPSPLPSSTPSPHRPTHTNPDIGGQTFTICDAGPLHNFADALTILATMSKGEVRFIALWSSAMLLLSHLVEIYHLTQQSIFPKLLPPIRGDLLYLQPPIFITTCVHVVYDDSRARLPPEKGGLGYTPYWTSVEGLHKTVAEHWKSVERKGLMGLVEARKR